MWWSHIEKVLSINHFYKSMISKPRLFCVNTSGLDYLHKYTTQYSDYGAIGSVTMVPGNGFPIRRKGKPTPLMDFECDSDFDHDMSDKDHDWNDNNDNGFDHYDDNGNLTD